MIGGFTTPWGAVIGTLGVWWLQEMLRFPWTSNGHFGFLQQQDRYWILGLLLIVVVLFRQQGILVRRPMRHRSPAPSG
jgi:ABC-type branched-subunit amino acid transport system permease subunit